jgi:pyruvate ferredoxin oxidoreductase beta subunit/2-oxoisovalerate ferredoxin oxidoreductase beta subunit
MMGLNIPKEILDNDFMYSGHLGCPGCGATIAMKFALKALGEKTIVVIPACCWGVIAGPYPQTALKVPILHTAFWAGDGGTFDIGFQSLSGAVERNEDVLYVCYDNEAYMNTGVQRSSSTPYGARTTTTPGGNWKKTRKKNIIETLAAHRIPYAATASIAFPEDMIRKFQKARNIKGVSRFIHVLATCPTGWQVPSEMSVKIARLAVQSNMFPLYEVEDGVRYSINYEGNLPVRDYLMIQGRFKHLTPDDIDHIQNLVDEDWQLLQRKVRC